MNKKGLSAVVGYVLLISFVMVMAGLVYYWMQSYLPKDSPECPDEISVFIEDYECSFPRIDLSFKNNGKFNIDGFFLRGTTDAEQEVATFDFSDGEEGGVIRFDMGAPLKPGEIFSKNFDFTGEALSGIYSIELIPIRYETVDNKVRLAVCGKARVSEKINCVG